MSRILNGGRMSTSSRSKTNFQVTIMVILLIGVVPVFVMLNSEPASSSASSGLDVGLVDGWRKNEVKAWDSSVGDGNTMDDKHDRGKNFKSQDVQKNSRRLNTSNRLINKQEHSSVQSKSNSKGNAHRAADPPVLIKDTLGNYEPPAQPRRIGLGEYGSGVRLNQSEAHLYQRAEEEYGFNTVISDRISLDRFVMDLRDKECKHWHYPTTLPNTSVVIVFHNEGWSTLLRTVHSVFNTAPHHLIAEVLLVDDFSDKTHLKEKLELHFKKPRFLGRVRIVRNENREGLIRSRMIGVTRAIGEVVTFLDAHCECGTNWLPPLLAEIALDRTTVVCPTVDAISADNFAYTAQDDKMCRGAFDWDFWYKRIPLQKSFSRLDLKHRSQPYPSPVMAGGLFAIDRSYFFELGGYDPGLKIWGGENFEISFKAWMCGGSLKFVPCSRVGHIYRNLVPYSYPESDIKGIDLVDLNYMRVVEVWLDDYREYFYVTRPQLAGRSCGDISDQVAFRRAHCPRSFRWYMEEVAFDILEEYPPPAPNKIWGEIRSVYSTLCLDTFGAQKGNTGAALRLTGCHGLGGNQLFRLNTNGQLLVDDGDQGQCVVISKDYAKFSFQKCDKFQRSEASAAIKHQWEYDEDRHIIYLDNRRRCLDHDPEVNRVFVSPCEEGSSSQKFTFYKEGIR